MRSSVLCCLLMHCALLSVSTVQADLQVLWRHQIPSETYCSPTALLGVDEYGPAAVITAKQGLVVAVDAAGRRLWEYSLGGRSVSPVAVGDLNRDGFPQVVVGDYSGVVSCLSRKGDLTWEVRVPTGILWACPALADLDGNGRLEVVVGDEEGNLTCVRHNGELAWRVQTGGSFGQGPAIGDLNGDGSSEIVIGSGHRLLCFAADGRWLWEHQFDDECYSAAVISDLDGDGRMEVLAGTAQPEATLHALDGVSGESRWVFKAKDSIDSAIAVADLDGDGSLEVLFGDGSATLFCLTAAGEMLWSKRLERGRQGGVALASAPVVGDVDGDGGPEVVLAAHDGKELVVLNSRGEVECSHELPSGSNGSPLLIPDRDGRALILVTGYRTKELVAFWTGASWKQEKMLWPAQRLTSTLAGYLRPDRALPSRFAAVSAAPTVAELHASLLAPLRVGPNAVQIDLPSNAGPRIVLADVHTPSGAHYRACLRPDADAEKATVQFDALDSGPYQLGFRTTKLPAEVEAEGSLSLTLVPFQSILSQAEAQLPRLAEAQSLVGSCNAAAARALRDGRTRLEGHVSLLRRAQQEFNRLSSDEKHCLLEQRDQADIQLQQLTSLAYLLEQLGPPESARQILAWPAKNPWEQPDIKSVPVVESLGHEVHYVCLGGEYESAALNLFNLGDEAVTVRVEFVPPEDESTNALPAECLEIRQVVAVPTSFGTMSSDALDELGSAKTVVVPAQRARQIWLTLHSQGLRPGDYGARIRLQPLTVLPGPQYVPLRATVADISLPDRPLPVQLCTWADANRAGSHRSRAVLRDLVAHYCDVFVGAPPGGAKFDSKGNLVGEIDWSRHDEYMKTYTGLGQFLFPGAMERLSYVGEGEPPRRAWQKAYARWLHLWVKHMREIGWDYDTWAFYPVDEPGLRHGESVRQLLEVARRVKSIDPKIRIYTDPVSQITLDHVRELLPYVDIWMPNLGFLIEGEEKPGDSADKIALMRSHGKIMWTYSPVGGAKEQHPTAVYRRHFWLAWRYGLTGVGFWTYYYENLPGIDPWKGPTELSGKPASVEYSIMYASGDRIIASKRWEAIREGVEDYTLMAMLQEFLSNCDERNIGGPDVDAARQLLEAGHDNVIDSGMDDGLLVQFRLQCIDTLTRLRRVLQR